MKFLYIYFFTIVVYFFVGFAHAEVKGANDALCRDGINSTVKVGMQLTHNPSFKIDDFNKFIDNQDINQKLKTYLKSNIATRLIAKNPTSLNNYISSGNAMSECIQSLSTP